VFVPENAVGGLEKVAQDQNDEQRFLDLLKKYDGQGRNMSSNPAAAKGYAPRIFAAEKNGISVKRFEQAMERLFEARKIHVEPYGPHSRGWSKIAPGAKQEAAQ
jgi:hypothetical protein